MVSFQNFRPEKLGQIDLNDGIVIDVRTQMEHSEKSLVIPHFHIPLDELKPTDFMMRHGLNKDSNVYILCRSGKRAEKAADKFIAEGYHNVHVIEGGIVACEGCGYEVQGHLTSQETSTTYAKKPISLERQVRIAAGAIAATGALLGLLVYPLFGIIPLFVGCGLVFAGITDWCGMALVLTKAPWNKGVVETSCAASTKGKTKTGLGCQ